MNLFISSTSTDENTGTGTLIIEGQLAVPIECDDPIVELFRPIRSAQKDQMFFTILVRRQEQAITCNLIPSNHKNFPQEIFVKDASSMLKGTPNKTGIMAEYKTILELFFTEKNGLETWKKACEKKDFTKCNELIKKFVADIGMTMPSRKKPEKKKKTRAEKRAEGKKYLEEHPDRKKD